MRYWTLVVVFTLLGLSFVTQSGHAQEVCDSVDISMGRYFHPHPTICTKYLQCAQRAGGWWFGKPRNCAPGLFWDSHTTSCRVPNAVRNPCANDPCLAGMDFYEAEGHCRSYFKCNGQTTDELLCCKIGDKWDQASKSCILDITRECVNDVCTDGPAIRDFPCRLSQFRMDSRFFYESVPAFGVPTMMMRSCPTGTAFNEERCGCTERIPVTFIRGCFPSMSMLFSGNKVRDFEFGHHITNVKVALNQQLNLGMFRGEPARLIVPRFANQDWRDSFVFYVVFATQNIVQTDAVIFANSGCPDELPSIKLVVKDTSFLEGTIVLEGGNTVSVTAQFTTMGYNLAVFVYDGAVLSLIVTRPDQTQVRDIRNVPATPSNVALRRCAFSVGFGTGGNYFRGFIEMVQVLLCN